jgi:hypothetical protein
MFGCCILSVILFDFLGLEENVKAVLGRLL